MNPLKEKSRHDRWWFKPVTVLIGAIAGLALAEAASRIFLAEVPGVIARFPADNPNYALTRKVDGPLGYEFVPYASLWDLSLNGLGLRDLNRKVDKEPGWKRILCMGDSITMGGSSRSYVPLLQTWPLVLERVLSVDAGAHVEAWNAGVVGYNLVQYAAFLEQKGITYHPDALVIGICLNDMASMQEMRREKGQFVLEWYARVFPKVFKSLDMETYRRLLKNSYLFRAVDIGVAALGQGDGEKIDLDAEENWAALRKIRHIAGRAHIPLLALLFPELGDQGVSNREMSWKHNMMANALEREKIKYIDLSVFFTPVGPMRLRQSPDDPIHPNVLGHCIAAAEAYKGLCSLGIKWMPKIDFTPKWCDTRGLMDY
ncbi:MAG: SGNH/GDSL hydrolase family protein [Deltaproteobacteria bacterium]|nr:SGNH/GDSL hydrolase family protein [Deltaproteobacteria bacterium]